MAGRALGRGPDEMALVFALLREGPPGVLLDVGAHHGSALLPFARRGWRVHAFEPDPANRAELVARCAGLAGVTIDPRAVSDRDGCGATLYTSPVSTGISALAPFHESHRPAGAVETLTLARYCTERALERVDVLKTDVEGFDLFVLRGFPWQRLHPRVVVCEFEDRKTRPLGWTLPDLAGFLAERGYRILVSEWHPVVEYGRRHRFRRFAPWPCALADPDAWGNLIAVGEPALFGRLLARAGLAEKAP